MNTELIVPSKETALSVYQSEKGLDPFLKHIRDEIDSFVPDVSTKKGRDAIASIAYKVAKSKTALDDVGKELVNDLKELPKKIDIERKRVRDILDSWKDEVRRPLTEWELAEEMRVATHKLNIENIKLALTDIELSNSAEIKNRILQVSSVVTNAKFEEYELEATRSKESVLKQLNEHLIKRNQYEAEQEELARLRADAAIREQKEREERIAKEAEERAIKCAEEKAKAEKEASEKRELELKLKAEKAEREKLEAMQREEKSKIEAIERERQLKIQAEENAKKAVEDEKKKQALEAERIEAERIKREQNKEHMRKINAQSMKAFIENGLSEDCAKLCISLIAKRVIPNITIEY